MRTLRFLPEAREELLEQVRYYGSLRPGLGVRFESAVSSAVRRAVEHPDRGAPRTANTRRMLVTGFPFSVIYRPATLEVLVVAIADSRRRPDYWISRLG